MIKIKPILKLQSKFLLLGHFDPFCPQTQTASPEVCHTLHTISHAHTHALWWACGTPRRSTGTKGRHTRVPTFSVPESWERETTEYTCDTAKARTHMLTHIYYLRWCPGHVVTASGWDVMYYWQEGWYFDILFISFLFLPYHRGSGRGGRVDWRVPTSKIQPELQLKDGLHLSLSQHKCISL